MLKKMRRIVLIALILFSSLLQAEYSDALLGKHENVTCGLCHSDAGGFAGALFDKTPKCLGGACHLPATQLTEPDASRLFNYSSAGTPEATSHAWGIPYNNLSAGAQQPATTQQSRYAPRGWLGCSSCHWPHYYLNNLTSQPLLKRDNTSDELCLDCHRTRNRTTSSTIQAGKQMSHPVGVQYPTVDTAFNIPPLDPYGVSGSEVKLVGPANDTVSCSSCHGVHFADSNPWTPAAMGSLSSVSDGQGVLLRRYNDSQLCKDCHRYQQHGPLATPAKWQDCRNCHDPHDPGNNFRLIRFDNFSGPRGWVQVTFDSLSSKFAQRIDGKQGICDACHSLSQSGPFPLWSSGHQTKGINLSQAYQANCLGCHMHAEGDGTSVGSFSAGGAAACADCHGFPPQANVLRTPGYADNSGSGGDNYLVTMGAGFVDESTSPHVRHAETTANGGYGSRFTGSGAYGTICGACHKNSPELTYHKQDSYQDVNFGLYTWPGAANSYTAGTKTCNQVYCHSDGAPEGSITYKAPTWGDGGSWPKSPASGDCAGCHLATPTSYAHTKHIEGSGLNFSFGCINCHANTVSDNTTISDLGVSTYHVDRTKSVFFGATGVSGSYTGGECSDTYCHGNFADNMGNSGNKPMFNGPATVCGSCHDLPPTGDITTHTKHVDTYEFGCAYCHYDLVNAAFDSKSTIDDQTKHVNSNEDVLFGNDLAGRTNAAGTYTKATGKCDTIYCHSAGTTTLAANFFVNESTIWNSATVTCASCHGNSVYSGMTSAMPNYPNGQDGKENSHVKHVVNNGIDCMTCHEVTLATNVTIGNYTAHVNAKYNVDISATYGGSYDTGTQTCTGVSCHGAGAPVWGSVLACSDCHNGSGDVNDFSYGNNTTAQIDNSAWTNTGHGRTTSYPPSTNPGANIACVNCHDSSVAHGDSGNPFRLYSSNPDQLCNICHGVGGSATKNGIFAHSSTTTEGRHNFTLKCVDCHDPHGDDNAFMLHSTLPQPNGQAGYEPSNQYGVPNGSVTWENVDFPDNDPAFLASTSLTPALTKVCNVCHSRTTDIGLTDSKARYRKDMASGSSAEAHYVGQQCTTSCHKHTNGFEGVSCEGCHGMPPVDAASLIFSPVSSDSVTLAGAHAKHAQIYSSGNRCNNCHDGGMDPTGILSAKIDIKFNGPGTYDTGTYDGNSGRSFYTYSGQGVGTLNNTNVCNSVQCHGTGLTNGQGFDTTPVWTDLATGDCGACHGAKKSAGTPFTNASAYPASGSHAKHAGFAAGQADILCKTCHDTTLTTATTLNDAIHVNAETGVTGVAVSAAYNDTATAFNYVDGTNTCENTDCHGEQSVVWGAAARTCDQCHNNTSDNDDFVFSNLSGTVAQINSTEYTSRGHGTSAKFAISSSVGPNLACSACHDTNVGHNAAGEYFRLYTSETDTLCLGCHGSGSNLSKGWSAFGIVTGYQNHSWENMSTAGYVGGANTDGKATWHFTPKCVDCHDPHGDNNNYMVHSYVNYSGSDAEGRPVVNDSATSFTGLLNWSSYVTNTTFNGVCQRCHDSSVAHFDSAQFDTSHNSSTGRCTNCHDHKAGFYPAGGSCDSCHLDATKEIDDYVYNNGNRAYIKTSEWEASAHYINGVGCYSCHDGDVTHGLATNPFRLHTSDTIAVCDNCHGTGGQLGVYTTANASATGIFTHNSSIVDNGNADFSIKCVDCHDPHGDSDNIKLIHDDLAEPNGGNGYTPSNQYGQPFEQNTTLWMNVDFTSNSVGTDYATEAAVDNISKVCNVCHSRTVDPSVPANERYQQDMNGQPIDSHNSATKCVNCHAHAVGFKGVPCDGCHGNPPVSVATLIGETGTDQSQPVSNSTTEGAHDRHKNALGVQITDVCSACHDTGMSTNFALNGAIDLGFTGWNVYTTGTYDGQSVVHGTNYNYSGVGFDGTPGDTLVCSNIKCHGQGGWLTDSAAAMQDPKWNDSTTGECGDCHGVKQSPGSGSWPTTLAHGKHANTATYDIMCTTCHNATVANDNTTLTDSVHVNGKSAVSLDTGNAKIEGTGGYTEDTVNGGAYQDCDNTYCHSEGSRFSNFSAPKVLLTWDQTDTCGSCHAGTATGPDYASGSPKFNSHSTHVLAKGLTCEKCHGVTTVDGTSIADHSVHVNMAYDVDIDAAYDTNGGTSNYTYAAPGGTCNDINCHGAGMKAGAFGNDSSPQWGDAAYGCGDCHQATGSTITQGGHTMHVSANPGGYAFLCGECHAPETAATHVDGFRTFTGGATLAGTGTCFNCHAGDTALAKSEWDAGTTRACGTAAACHSGRADQENMSGRHTRHVSTVSGYSFGCVRCHETAVTDDTTINLRSIHANGTKNIDFDTTTPSNNNGSYDIGVTNQCTNIYCHSDGTDLVASDYPMGNYTADWDDNPLSTKTGAGKECSYCHGNKVFGGWTSAMPNYPDESPKQNSHVPHVITNGIECMACHKETLSANNTIGNYTAHVNGNYNVDIDIAYGGTYTYYADGGTCSGVSCHGASTPKWGDSSSAKCLDCHSGSEQAYKPLSTSGNGSNPVSFQQFTSTGHGRNSGTTYAVSGSNGAGFYVGDGSGCANCHDLSAQHTTKDTSDPYRLGAYANNVNGLCTQASCHIGQQNHDEATTGSVRTWPMGTKCVDCHDPHGDGNLYMIRSAINGPSGATPGTGGSDVYGTPLDQSLTTVIFDNTGGKAQNSYAQAAPGTPGQGICEACHSSAASPTVAWYNQEGDSNKTGSTHETRTGDCTSCHKHNTTGFQGVAGASSGGAACTNGCHSLETLMSATDTYHHAMRNVSAVYTNQTNPAADDVTKRCLMCHVDHDIFNSNKALNLRQDMSVQTGINTDFYPAYSAGKYAATDPVAGVTGNGICISCHDASKVKNTNRRYNSDGSTKARGLNKFVFYSSSHNYQIMSSMNNFDDGSSFRANCSKCHRSQVMNKPGTQTGAFEFGLHQSNTVSLLNISTADIAKPKIEELCYRCHSDQIQATFDEYSSVEMTEGAKMIKTAIVGKKSGHPIDSTSAEGRHKPDEFDNVTTGDDWNPAATRHVECVDCHNTHGGNARIVRSVGSANGNGVAGSQKGAWGVQLTYGGGAGTSPTAFTKTDQVSKQYELCIKCHSSYAYGATAPGVPSGLPDLATNMTADPYDNFLTTVSQSDVAKHINPDNVGFHPVYSVGRNQPSKTLNSEWVTLGTKSVKYWNKFTNQTTFQSVSGLSWTMVPPWNTQSTLACSDCHQADNSGQAVGKIVPAGAPTGVVGFSSPTQQQIQSVDDGLVASCTSCASASMTVDVNIASPPTNPPVELWIVAYASTTATGNGTKTTLEVSDGALTDNGIVRFGPSLSRGEVQVTGLTGQNSWATINANFTAKVTMSTTTANVQVDYLGLEGIYVADGAMRGPHGSLERWILMDVDPDVQMDTDDNGSMELLNSGITDPWQKKVFCWNCHRKDVYSVGAASENLSRFPHDAVDGSNYLSTANNNIWGIVCMNCHGGYGAGEIHGSWADNIATWDGSTDLVRDKGIRLMNGAVVNIKIYAGAGTAKDTGTCYTNTAASPYSNTCVGQHALDAKNFTYNYNYNQPAW